jgi:hypothetical protein
MILFLDNQEILSSSKVKILTLVRDCKSLSIQLVMISYSPVGIYIRLLHFNASFTHQSHNLSLL